MTLRYCDRTVLVQNVSSKVSVQEIRDKFVDFGAIQCIISPALKTYYIVYNDMESVPNALASLQGQVMGTRQLQLSTVGEYFEDQLVSLIIGQTPVGEQPKLNDFGSVAAAMSALSPAEKEQLLQMLGVTPTPTTVASGALDTNAFSAEGAVGGVNGTPPVSKPGKLLFGAPPISNVGLPYPPVVTQPLFSLANSLAHNTPIVSSASAHQVSTPVLNLTNPFNPQYHMSAGLPQVPNLAPLAVQPWAKLSQFSGDSSRVNETSYRQWRTEVRGLQAEGYGEGHVIGCMRRVLRGTASDLLLHLGEQVTVAQVLNKFDRVFGDVLPTEKVLEQFYTAQQGESEQVAVWACRLEDILSRVTASSGSAISPSNSADMLRTKFWSGLSSPNVRNALRHRYDNGVAYDDLLVAARVQELEMSGFKPIEKVKVKSNQVSSASDVLADKVTMLTEQLTKVMQRLDGMDGKSTGSDGKSRERKPFTGNCFKCNEPGHKYYQCKKASN